MVWKVVIEIVTVVMFRMDNGGGNGAGCFELEIWADTAKFTNVIVAGFRKCRDLVGEAIRCSSKIKPRLRAEWVVVVIVFAGVKLSVYLRIYQINKYNEIMDYK